MFWWKTFGKKVATALKCNYSELVVNIFPDNELRVRFAQDVKNKVVVLIQSFFGNINDKIIETILAGHTAKELKAKKVILIALYFPYLREDKRFHKGECVSAKILPKLFYMFDWVFVMAPICTDLTHSMNSLKMGTE